MQPTIQNQLLAITHGCSHCFEEVASEMRSAADENAQVSLSFFTPFEGIFPSASV
jgi:hypothetical protein